MSKQYNTCPYCGANLDPGGIRGWFTRLCYQGETDDKETK